jgi:hypothetical protein
MSEAARRPAKPDEREKMRRRPRREAARRAGAPRFRYLAGFMIL